MNTMKTHTPLIGFALFSLMHLCTAIPTYVSHKNCNGKPPGTFVAHPSNCSQYIRCNGLRSQLGDCPSGTYFNARLLSCDKTQHACIQLTATTAPTTVPTKEPQLPQDGSLGRPLCTPWFDQQFPHPYNCEYYYDCVRGHLSVRRCSFGFGWDLDHQACAPLSEANCFKYFLTPSSQ